MVIDKLDDVPWPSEGLPLAEALQRLTEPHPFWFGGASGVDAETARTYQAKQFCQLAVERAYLVKGRPRSMTAQPIEIQVSTLFSHFDFTHAGHSEIRERFGDRVILQDVRVWQPVPGISKPPKPADPQPVDFISPARTPAWMFWRLRQSRQECRENLNAVARDMIAEMKAAGLQPYALKRITNYFGERRAEIMSD
jgi:hypothetical protein